MIRGKDYSFSVVDERFLSDRACDPVICLNGHTRAHSM